MCVTFVIAYDAGSFLVRAATCALHVPPPLPVHLSLLLSLLENAPCQEVHRI